MADVIRIDQVPRRSPTPGPTRPSDRRIDRAVDLPVHRSADRAVAPAAAVRPATDARTALTEGELAIRFFPLALGVAAVDLATKAWAVTALAERSVTVAPWLSLSLAFNRASAGGISLGADTRAINFTATGIVVGLLVMLAPTLTRVDRRAWRALALIAGAGLGNQYSLLQGERGVPDFLAIPHGTGAWVLNVADVALAVGLALLGASAWRIARAARAERAAKRPAARPIGVVR